MPAVLLLCLGLVMPSYGQGTQSLVGDVLFLSENQPTLGEAAVDISAERAIEIATMQFQSELQVLPGMENLMVSEYNSASECKSEDGYFWVARLVLSVKSGGSTGINPEIQLCVSRSGKPSRLSAYIISEGSFTSLLYFRDFCIVSSLPIDRTTPIDSGRWEKPHLETEQLVTKFLSRLPALLQFELGNIVIKDSGDVARDGMYIDTSTKVTLDSEQDFDPFPSGDPTFNVYFGRNGKDRSTLSIWPGSEVGDFRQLEQ
jgi:hypothetical protein